MNFTQQGIGHFPANAGIGYGYTVFHFTARLLGRLIALVDITFDHQTKSRILLTFLLVVMCLLTLAICAPFSSHDWQRAVQISVALCAVVYGLCLPQAERCVDRPTVLGVWLIGLAGLVSALLAHQPLWALTELALLISCGAIAVAFCRARRNGDESLDRVLILFVLLLCMIKSVQYLHAGVLAFTSGESVVDPDLLLSGFSNKRFYGQLQTFTLPLLALPLLVSNVARPARAAVFALLCVWSRILLTPRH